MTCLRLNATMGSIMKGEELRRLRERRLKMTQGELAGALDMQRNSITRMEIGLRPITRVTEFAVRHLLAMKTKKRGTRRWR